MATSRADVGNRVSTVLARKLGGELLRLREDAGLTQPRAAEVLSASVAKVTKMERGWVPFRDPDVIALCKLYGVQDESAVEGLLQIARLDRERRKAKGWWKPDAGNLSEYIAMEDVAVRIRTWQLSVVPGLFQTADYVRALAVSGGVWENPDDIERLVAVRMKRQARLQGENPLRVHAVIWEAALRQLVGGAEVMREQLSHLHDLAKLPNVHIQVLPFRAGAHPSIGGPFNILSFLDSAAMEVVHMDTLASTQWVEDAAHSTVYQSFFESTARLSLSPYASSKLIDDMGKGLHD
ncbi:helix-turn-helix domain-containing protein [Streptomyces sp. NPDC088197]|uniref:helix-turn-helix domain-containing protein n=1 Tax=unclassified Streptomyces TaxID=2593676 RepID=UPI0033B15015